MNSIKFNKSMYKNELLHFKFVELLEVKFPKHLSVEICCYTMQSHKQ